MNILVLVVLLACLTAFCGGQRAPVAISKDNPVHIALALDKGSLQEILVLLESITSVALEPEHVIFHIVFVGASDAEAETLMRDTMAQVRTCFPDVNIDAKPFSFARTSGFIKQVSRDNSGSKWVSPLATDMVRFFMAQLFPSTPRLLYLDNDVVVTCCLEQIWMSTLKPGTALGLVVDHIPWSVTTQFAQHYNASHPLVIKAIRRAGTTRQGRLTLDEFNELMKGKYPNDGVLLIDTDAFNALSILQDMEAIAFANSPSADRNAGCHGAACEGTSWVVSLGSQQFTVLGLAGRWTELDQRANVRHFPDKARGYLMWFYYHGFLHYAGRMKPRDMCARVEARTMREMTPHRVQTYTPFAITAKKLYAKCPANLHTIIQAAWCSKHIPDASSGEKFLDVVRGWLDTRHTMAKSDMPPSNHHIRLGTLRGDMGCAANCTSTLDPNGDLVAELERELLHRSSLSFTLFTLGASQPKSTLAELHRLIDLPQKHRKAKNQGGPRGLNIVQRPGICGCGTPDSKRPEDCTDVLSLLRQDFKMEHWHIASISIDAGAASLGILQALDLTYLRPKALVVKLGPYATEAVAAAEAAAAAKVIARNGLDMAQAKGNDPRCGCESGSFCACVWGIRINVLEVPNKK